jgi:HEAT repeat protein
LHDPERLEELYSCLFNEDAWVRMRAADALENLCPSTFGLV